MAIRIRLTWTDNNAAESGHRVYRSDTPMDPNNLPEPLAELGPDVTEYVDEDVTEDATYYYRVSAFTPFMEKVSDEVMQKASMTPPFPEILGVTQVVTHFLNFNNNQNVPYPSGVTAGDLLIMVTRLKSGSTNTPEGWSLVASPDTNTRVYSKVADGTEGSSINVTFTNSIGSRALYMYRVASGSYDTDTPIAVRSQTASATTVTCPTADLGASWASKQHAIISILLQGSASSSHSVSSYPYENRQQHNTTITSSAGLFAARCDGLFSGQYKPASSYVKDNTLAARVVDISIRGK